MRLSRFFLPTSRETPADAQIVSHRLMLRAGMIRQSSAGIYSWLPLGLKALRNIERIVREEQDRAGVNELLMPTIQPAELWRESGRYDDYGKEMLRIRDRHERDLLYGPTNEEMVTEIVRGQLRSYRALPINLYHIQWKFRDEVRPRFGVMRGREFLMKDAYSFDLDEAGARRSYNNQFLAYLRSFARMGLRAIPMKADTGPIGGDLSHEFIILAATGESEVFYHRDWDGLDVLTSDLAGAADLQPFVDWATGIYAATSEKHDPAACPAADLRSARGIEVGHIFYFGTKYSAPMRCEIAGPDGQPVTLHMGSYGIGVSRLVGAIIEASHDDAGIVWPDPVAPFQVVVVNLKQGDAACDQACEAIYGKLGHAGLDALYDDRADRAGVKLADADLVGSPWQVLIGPRGVAQGTVELKRRATGEKHELDADAAFARILG
jgi:prolyl-tRNA synthetase